MSKKKENIPDPNFVRYHKIFYDKSSTLKSHRFVCIMKTSYGRFKRTVVFTHAEYLPLLFKKAMLNS